MFGESTDNINCQAYIIERKIYNCLVSYHKKQVISNQMNENRENTKGLFQIINKLTGNKAENPMPPSKDEELDDDFTTFFHEKKSTKYEI